MDVIFFKLIIFHPMVLLRIIDNQGIPAEAVTKSRRSTIGSRTVPNLDPRISPFLHRILTLATHAPVRQSHSKGDGTGKLLLWPADLTAARTQCSPSQTPETSSATSDDHSLPSSAGGFCKSD
ncbi:hypothetical protein TIFTF001_004292 [Ficus carica]|uniref:Uncharacterized protein n=1 Tax=Ficus carica TaxID=3494 RepID=A0AA88CSZ5_FICCA|nr:hypothetical protein TIFTF001_004292 [Ficus carica]